MQKQTEQLLTSMLRRVVDGLPDYKGGYIEQPVESEAKKLLFQSGGVPDAAVFAAAHDFVMRVECPRWSTYVQRSAVRAVVGTLPVIGTASAVFYSQFESFYQHVRFVSLAACLYGHDVRDEALQSHILLCIINDMFSSPDQPIPNPQSQILNSTPENKNKNKNTSPSKERRKVSDLEKEIATGTIEYAATALIRKLAINYSIQTITTSFIFNRALGGLLVGVLPELLSLISSSLSNSGTSSKGEKLSFKIKKHVKIIQTHFKFDLIEQPKLRLLKYSLLSLILLSLCKLFLIPHGLTYIALACIALPFVYLRRHFLIPYLASIVLLAKVLLSIFSVKSLVDSLCLFMSSSSIYHLHKFLVSSLSHYCPEELAPYSTGLHLSLVLWVGGLSNVVVLDSLGVLSTISTNILVDQVSQIDVLLSLLNPSSKVHNVLYNAAKHVVSSPSMVLEWLESISPSFAFSLLLLCLQHNYILLGWFASVYPYRGGTGVLLVSLYLVCYLVYISDRKMSEPDDNVTVVQACAQGHRIVYLVPLGKEVKLRVHVIVKYYKKYTEVRRSTDDMVLSLLDRLRQLRDSVYATRQPPPNRNLLMIEDIKTSTPALTSEVSDVSEGYRWFGWFRRQNKTEEEQVMDELISEVERLSAVMEKEEDTGWLGWLRRKRKTEEEEVMEELITQIESVCVATEEEKEGWFAWFRGKKKTEEEEVMEELISEVERLRAVEEKEEGESSYVWWLLGERPKSESVVMMLSPLKKRFSEAQEELTSAQQAREVEEVMESILTQIERPSIWRRLFKLS